MAESIKDVIARLKAQGQAPAKVPEIQKKAPAVVEQEFDDEDEEEQEVEEVAVVQEKPVKKQVNPQNTQNQENPNTLTPQQQVMAEVEMLQNNGRFRAELLFQLQEINKALVVIAGVMVDRK